ncbi:hypothetical protein ACFL5X_03540 [Candidatus Omnitrophota bacterium]
MRFRKVILYSLLVGMLFSLLPYGRGNPDLEWFRDRYHKGRYAEIIKRADSLLRSDPDDPVLIEWRNQAEEDQWVLDKAKKYYSSRDYQEAYILLSRLLETSPESDYIAKLKKKAAVYLERQQEKLKAEEMNALKDKIASIRKAEEYISQGEEQRARTMLLELAALYPQDEKIRALLSKLGVERQPISQPMATSYTRTSSTTSSQAAPAMATPAPDRGVDAKQLLAQKNTLIRNFKVALSQSDLIEAQSTLQILEAKYPGDAYVEKLALSLGKHKAAADKKREALKARAYKQRLSSDYHSTKQMVADLIKQKEYDRALNELAALEKIYPGENGINNYVDSMRSKISSYKDLYYRNRFSYDYAAAKKRVAGLMKDKDYDGAVEELKTLVNAYPQERAAKDYALAMDKKIDAYRSKDQGQEATLKNKSYQEKMKADLAAIKRRVAESLRSKSYDLALNDLGTFETLYPGEKSVLSYTKAMRTKIESAKDKAQGQQQTADIAAAKAAIAGLMRDKQYSQALKGLGALESRYPNDAGVSNYVTAIKAKIDKYADQEQQNLALAMERDAQLEASRKALARVESSSAQAVQRPVQMTTQPQASAASAAAPVRTASSPSSQGKGAAIEKARNMLVMEEYEPAEQLLISLKADYPDDKEIDSLLNYVGLKLISEPPERDRSQEDQYTPQDEKFYTDAAAGMSQDGSSAVWGAASVGGDEVHDAAKLIKIRELYYKGIKLYRQRLYAESMKCMAEVVKLEGNPRIYYTPSAKKLMRRAEEKRHEGKMQDWLDSEERSDDRMLERAADFSTTPYIEPPVIEVEREDLAVVVIPEIRKKLEKVINLDFDNVSLKYVAEFITAETGANIILSGKVLEAKPKVTAKFDNIPAFEAIRYMLKSAGLAYRVDENVVWMALPEEIDTEELETRIYKLTKGAGLFTEFSTSEKSGLGGGLSSFATISKIETLEDTLRLAVDWSGGAKLVLDKRTNSLIVTNTPKNLETIEDILYNLDVSPYQILIEARFLEVDVTDVRELGVEWIFDSDVVVGRKDGATSHGIDDGGEFDFNAFTNAGEGLNLTYQGVLTDPQFRIMLHALERSDKTKTLSAPRITTLNNQLATIKLVDEWIYPTRYEFQIVQFDLNGDGDFDDAGETEFQNVPTDFVRRDVGIILKVLPSMGIDGETVSLSLVPEVSEGTAGVYEYSGNISLPQFTSRNLATTVVVTSGDTVVLGGMIRETRTNESVGVPFLSDIPFIGQLFRKDESSIQRRNLLIFVTARIISPSGRDVRTVPDESPQTKYNDSDH